VPKTAVVEVVEVVVEEEPPSSVPHEMMVRLKRKTNKTCKILLIIFSTSYERRRFEELLFQHFTNRLSIQSDILAYIKIKLIK